MPSICCVLKCFPTVTSKCSCKFFCKSSGYKRGFILYCYLLSDRLNNNTICDAGVMVLARNVLPLCSKLKTLGYEIWVQMCYVSSFSLNPAQSQRLNCVFFPGRLAGNKISDVGMMCLSSEGIPHCPSLTTLRSVLRLIFSLFIHFYWQTYCCANRPDLFFNNSLGVNKEITSVGWKHFLEHGLPHCLYIT